MPNPWFGVLGALSISDGSADIILPAGKQRTILALLLLRSNQFISPAELVDELWEGDSAPPLARANLQTYVSKLRGRLGKAAAGRIRADSRGYRLEVADHELDLLAFHRLRTAGQRARDSRQWQRASSLLTEALRLWRGQPLFDVCLGSCLVQEIDFLTVWRMQAVEARLDADLHLGRHREVLTEFQRFAVAHPLHEPLQRMYMLACYRSGLRADAVLAYRRAEGCLGAELGLRPGPDMRRLLARIEKDDPLLMDLTAEFDHL
jgi:DNA-binding SARP family transcriptional activator